MATKKKTDMIPGLKDSAYDIWLAGLGAFSLAGEEGSRLFKQLVEKGSELEGANKARITSLTDNLSERAQSLKGEAKSALGKIASPLEGGLATAMQRLGVPTRDEIVNLTQRVEELTKLVAKSKASDEPKPKARTTKG
jgi:poly(hydroxyalkanoate) granule-associated protein